jgi:hypothetical protein
MQFAYKSALKAGGGIRVETVRSKEAGARGMCQFVWAFDHLRMKGKRHSSRHDLRDQSFPKFLPSAQVTK